MSLCIEFDQMNQISEVIRYVVDTIPQEKLEIYAKFSDAFKKGGFRLGNVKGIKSQMIRMVESKEIIEDPLRKLLSDHSQCSRVLRLLSTETITSHWKEFAIFFGKENILFASLLDEREAIRKEAIRLFNDKDEERSENSDKESDLVWASSRLAELLWPIWKTFGSLEKDTSGAAIGGNFEVQRELKELRSKSRQLERVEKQLKVAEEKKKEAEEREKKAESKAEIQEKEAAEARNRAENAEAELLRNKRNAHSQAEAIIQTRITKEFAKWFGTDRSDEIEQALPGDFFAMEDHRPSAYPGEKDFDELVSETKKALIAQSHADAIGGVRSVFEKRLSILQELLRNCNDSLANAIRPTEALLGLRGRLEEECKRLQVILHRERTDTPVYDSLSVAINTAHARQLPEWTHILEKLEKTGLLSKESHEALLALIHRRYATVHLQGVREIREEDLEDPANVLRMGLEGRLAVSLLIDGHNVLFALQSRYARPQDHHFPSREARQWLQDDVVQMFSQSPSCYAILGYDGPERTDQLVSENVRMIYSGGEGEHRADRVLLDEARFIVRDHPGQRLLLVTNDRDLAKEASRLGVGNLAPTDLLAYFP